jgi:hypothetical protein
MKRDSYRSFGPWSKVRIGEFTLTRCLGIQIRTLGKMRVIRVWRWKHLFGKETR